MGLMQRQKGKRFERSIATILRAHFPDAAVRRASQADRAHQSDVYITGGPPLLARLWLECQDARNPTPIAKLEQAERDVLEGLISASERLPVAIWHKFGARSIQVTLRMSTLDEIRVSCGSFVPATNEVVTMDLDAFLSIVSRHPKPLNVPRETEAA